MPLDLTDLNSAITAMNTEVARATTTEDSAGVALSKIQDIVNAAVTKALTDDAAANAGSIKAATDAVNTAFTALKAGDDKLADAITANTPNA